MLGSMKIINYLDYRPKYDVDKCVKSKSSKSACDKCYEACPYNAIELYRKGIKITDKCNYCGICASYCPSNAIADGGRRFCRNKDEIYVVCSQQEKEDIKDQNIKVDCLRAFSTKMLLNLYIRGIRKININVDKCKDCTYSHKIEEELAFANEILEELNKPLIKIEEMEVDMIYDGLKISETTKSEQTVDRRNFFKQLAKEVFSVGYELAPPAMKEDSWEGLIQIIKKLETEETKGLSLYNVHIDNSKCIECNACIKLCPEKVWKTIDDGLETEAYNCNGCGLCKDICPTKAIDIEKDVRIREFKLEKNELKTCNICEKEFSTYLEEKMTCSKCMSKIVFRNKD